MRINILGSDISIRLGARKSGMAVKDISAKPNERNIRKFYAHMLEKAAKKSSGSIMFSPIGCVSGFPMLASAKIAAQETLKHLRGEGRHLKKIIFSVHNAKEAAAFNKGVISYLRHFTEDLSDRPFTTVDVIIEVKGGIVIIERSNPPFGFALPGGFVDNGETLEKAAQREAREETGLKVYGLKQFHTYSDPDRDPRFHTIGTVFIAKAKGRPRAGSDAAGARIVPLKDLKKYKFAFDHSKILKDYVKYKK